VRASKLFLPGIFIAVALISSPAGAEVYESKDAQGNTVFSDMPSQGAAEVKVPPTNSADPVAITPRPPPPPETPAKPRKSSASPAGSEHEERDDDYLYYGGDYDRDEIDDQNRREKRRWRGETDKRSSQDRTSPQRLPPGDWRRGSALGTWCWRDSSGF
jgi:Domain of unknown function (DUF4124)